jgi:hypothetical protein
LLTNELLVSANREASNQSGLLELFPTPAGPVCAIVQFTKKMPIVSDKSFFISISFLLM